MAWICKCVKGTLFSSADRSYLPCLVLVVDVIVMLSVKLLLGVLNPLVYLLALLSLFLQSWPTLTYVLQTEYESFFILWPHLSELFFWIWCKLVNSGADLYFSKAAFHNLLNFLYYMVEIHCRLSQLVGVRSIGVIRVKPNSAKFFILSLASLKI